MKALLTILLLGAAIYAVYFMYTVVVADKTQVASLQQQLANEQQALADAQAQNQTQGNALGNSQGQVQKLQTIGGALTAIWDSIV